MTFGSWNTGVEMSDCLLAERRHRHNQGCAERRRFGFPTIGHFDTWLIDQLQNLMMENHGFHLYPTWSNSSDYKDTDESFDTVALHNYELHEALNKKCGNVGTEIKLTREQKYLCSAMGTPLPFLPFHGEKEKKKFATYILENNSNVDENFAAIEWCAFVDGVDIFPKLPVHFRNHMAKWEKKQRIEDCVLNTKKGAEKLAELNKALGCTTQSTVASISTEKQQDGPQDTLRHQPIFNKIDAAPSLPLPRIEAMHNLPHTVVGGTFVGNVACVNTETKFRGKDRSAGRKRACKKCNANDGVNMYACKGRGRRGVCEFFDLNGLPIGKSKKTNNKKQEIIPLAKHFDLMKHPGEKEQKTWVRICGRCRDFGGQHLDTCKGRGRVGRKGCDYFNEDGTNKGGMVSH